MTLKLAKNLFHHIEISTGANAYFVGEKLQIDLPEGYRYLGRGITKE
ncbi:MAG: hypothetical protein AB8G15_20000 [Saprospiraceae bacterium]